MIKYYTSIIFFGFIVSTYSSSIDKDSINFLKESINIENSQNSDCKPPCRKGYFCYKGECISECNPPCPEGYKCDSDLNDCVPIFNIQKSLNQPSDEIIINNSFIKEEDVKNVGNVFFNITNVIYGVGTGFSSIAPLVMKEVYKTDINDYDDNGYNSAIAIENLGPVAFVFSISGALNQVARYKQRRYLRALGVKPNGGFIAASWFLYAASIHTANWNIYSQTKNCSDDLRTSSGIINMIALFSSYLISNISYHRNKSDLENAVNNRNKQALDLKLNNKYFKIFPYYSYDSKSKSNKVGLGLNF